MTTENIKGLSSEEVVKKQQAGEVNIPTAKGQKSVREILKDNLFTFFNLLNCLIAAAVILVGSYQNALFILIILCNALIGTVQEIRAKKSVEKLTILAEPMSKVIRDGECANIDIRSIVKGDYLIFENGNQICADSVVVSGEVEVNEALLTGEADLIFKKKGDFLYSGSAVVSGNCIAEVKNVGDDNYCEKITAEAKKFKKPKSHIMTTLNGIIKTISVFIVPIGLVLFIKQFFILHDSIEGSVTSAAAAMIGMIPEGLILLTTLVFAASVIRCAKRKTLVREMYGIEQLARVDVLCLDKTGTITEGSMTVSEVVGLTENTDVHACLKKLIGSLEDNNPTFAAMKNYTCAEKNDHALRIIPFSSERKWSGAVYENGFLAIGAPECVLKNIPQDIEKRIRKFSDDGYRVLILAGSSEQPNEFSLPEAVTPLGIVVLSDVIKPEAADTLNFFKENGVQIKIISGDSAHTVSSIARRAGVGDCDNFININDISDEELYEIADKYTIFGRVLPEQKKKLVCALKKKGLKTAMVGDGVNDVLALREADCSVAMASGSSAAGSVAQFVLLDNKLSSLYDIVIEGRRAVNNVSRSASLFLTKTIYSFLLSAIFMALPLSYPFKPIQLSLISTVAVGIPSFILAMEPNKQKIKGDFLKNIITAAIPSALVIVIHVIVTSVCGSMFALSQRQLSTLAVFLTATVNITLLISISRPFNKLRAALIMLVTLVFALAYAFFGTTFFMMAPIDVSIAVFWFIGILYGTPLFWLFKKLSSRIYDWAESRLSPLLKRRRQKRES